MFLRTFFLLLNINVQHKINLQFKYIRIVRKKHNIIPNKWLEHGKYVKTIMEHREVLLENIGTRQGAFRPICPNKWLEHWNLTRYYTTSVHKNTFDSPRRVTTQSLIFHWFNYRKFQRFMDNQSKIYNSILITTKLKSFVDHNCVVRSVSELWECRWHLVMSLRTSTTTVKRERLDIRGQNYKRHVVHNNTGNLSWNVDTICLKFVILCSCVHVICDDVC